MTDSVLWQGSTIEKDRTLVRALVYRYVGGCEEHKEACVEKIIKTIQTPSWQTRFPKHNFIFCVYYSMSIQIGEIRISLLLQAIDSLYPYLAPEGEQSRKDITGMSFAGKIKQISKVLYDKELNEGTPEAIGELRNRLFHTASFDGYDVGEMSKPVQFIDKAVQPHNPGLSHLACVRFFARSMSPLIGEMTVRALGLNDDDVSRGSNSPLWHPWFFKK